MTEISPFTYSTEDVELFIRQRGQEAKRIDVMAEALGREKNAHGLRLLLDVGLLDPQQASDIGESRYRAIYPILTDSPGEHIPLITDWMAQIYRAQPDLATAMLCEVISKSMVDFSHAKTVYKCCARLGMDMHRQAFVFLHKMGEIASTIDRFDLAYHTPFAAMMCRLPAPEIMSLMKDGTLTTLDSIPPAGEMMTMNGNGRQLNLLEYFGLFHANNVRTLCLISLLDGESKAVREGLADSIVSMVAEFGMKDNKTGPTDIALKIAIMIVAGADLERLGAGMRAIEPKNAGEQRNIFHILAGADHVKLGTTSTSRYEPVIAAVEKLTKTITPELAKTFEFDINADNGIGKTPLHFAAKTAGTAVIEHLLHAGANYAARTNDNVTPEETARALGRDDVAAMLQSWGARQAVQSVINRARP